jgi:hypothetical protein
MTVVIVEAEALAHTANMNAVLHSTANLFIAESPPSPQFSPPGMLRYRVGLVKLGYVNETAWISGSSGVRARQKRAPSVER